MEPLHTPEEYGYVQHDNIVLFQKGPLSQWYGGFDNQPFSGMIHGNPPEWCFVFNCCEQWMMWHKACVFGDAETAKKIERELNPAAQKALGREVKNFDPVVWDTVKEDIVFAGNFLKFTQNEHLRTFLKQFPFDTIFAEAAPWDPVWGIGIGPTAPFALDPSQWRGQNLLGKAISRVRKLI